MTTENKALNTAARYTVPVADICESADGYILRLEMPGVAKENLQITLDNNELEISGKVEAPAFGNEELRLSEYALHDYYRTFRVGNDIDRNRVEAALENGVLTVQVHKHEEAKPKRIEISVH